MFYFFYRVDTPKSNIKKKLFECCVFYCPLVEFKKNIVFECVREKISQNYSWENEKFEVEK